MNPARWMLNRVKRVRVPDPQVRLTVRNATRQCLLADCLEVADHGVKRSVGLLGRACLANGEGLWILPCEAVHTFGMRFPIDLVYLDRSRRVTKVCSGVRPWRLSASVSAHSVIELAAGTVRETRTAPGDMLEFSAADPPD